MQFQGSGFRGLIPAHSTSEFLVVLGFELFGQLHDRLRLRCLPVRCVFCSVVNVWCCQVFATAEAAFAILGRFNVPGTCWLLVRRLVSRRLGWDVPEIRECDSHRDLLLRTSSTATVSGWFNSKLCSLHFGFLLYYN